MTTTLRSLASSGRSPSGFWCRNKLGALMATTDERGPASVTAQPFSTSAVGTCSAALMVIARMASSCDRPQATDTAALNGSCRPDHSGAPDPPRGPVDSANFTPAAVSLPAA